MKVRTLLPAVLICGARAAAQTPTLTTLYAFKGYPTDGSNPWASVTIGGGTGGRPVLYGTTVFGGPSQDGTIFALTPPETPGGSWTESVLYSFTGGSDGFYPTGGLVTETGFSGHPVLYGTTQGGNSASCCGSVFQLTAGSDGAWTLATLYRFGGGKDGYGPKGVVLGGAGSGQPVFYGTTGSGGASNAGTVFSLTPPVSTGAPWTEAVLYSFTGGRDGGHPLSGVVVGKGSSGQMVLYGTASSGGIEGNGTVFSLTPPALPGGAWTEAVLHAFTGGADGSGPAASVTIGPAGDIYGTTYFGGAGPCTSPGNAPGCGTVFALEPAASGGAWIEGVLHSFMGSDGSNPSAGVAILGEVLYGTASTGGRGSCPGIPGCGTLFSLTPPATLGGVWTATVLHYFTGQGDGSGPSAGLIVGLGPVGHGVLYGTAYGGTSAHAGTVFELAP